MEEGRRRIPAAKLALAASLWMAVAGNLPLWREMHALGLLQAHGGWLLGATLTGAVAAALFGILSLLAWRPLLKPAITLLLLVTALVAYFTWTYHVVIDGSMASSVLQTDLHEVRSLLTPWLVPAVVLGAGVPAWLVWRCPVRCQPWLRQLLQNAGGAVLGVALIAALLLAGFGPLASAMRNHRHLRFLLNPVNALYALAAAEFGSHGLAGPPAPFGRDAHLAAGGGRPRLLVLVLGETGRSGNFGVNGYRRDTTPELRAARAVSFRNAWSCGTSTAASVPCMFSGLGRDAFLERKRESENLMDVLQHAGLAVLWIDNQAGGCKGVCDRVPNVNTSGLQDARLCAGGECHDEILLAGLDQRVARLPPERRARGLVVVLHQMGSHGPDYALRSPPAFKRFLPECATSHLPDCDARQLRNAYDNTVAYTDHVLGSTIAWLRGRGDYDGALLYVADHGESLGENNLYLHGLPYALAPDVQKHVPWVTWLSPAFERDAGLSMRCLRRHGDDRITHDHLFHTVLGLMRVSTSVYRPALDAYAACEGQGVPATLP